MHITLCLLTRNERECLEKIYPLIPPPSREAGYDDLVAIDGGSTDGTLEFYKERGVRVIGQSRRGRGEAFLLAFRDLQSDAFLFFSPDGNEDVADLPKFRKHLEAGADLVIASRMMKGAVNEEDHQVLRMRKWANNGFNLLANLMFRKQGPYITDSINGYRAITARATRILQLDSRDYTIEYQMTMRAMKHGLNIIEFPTVEGQRVAGETGAPSVGTGLRFIRKLWTEARIK
ncbi:MAG: glycosyltransferase family 2 protein [Candidatus Solibacter sp.]|nr:glycosyltransferase family 2 protein [Candidatus Solibacter sp.]